jgi:phage-related protein
MPIIGQRCHELRIPDEHYEWRIVYRIDVDAIIIAAVFAKKTLVTPKRLIEVCRLRLRVYDSLR